MTDKEKYMLNIQGQLIEVSEDVYYAYFRMERQERWQEEKQLEHGVVSYDALDNGEMVGAESVTDVDAPSLEDLAIAKELKDRLHHAIATLPKAERELIHALYFEDISAADYADQVGMSHRGVNKQRKKILSRLKLFLDFMGSFC